MSEFDSLRCHFSESDDGARGLTEQEFTNLSLSEVNRLIEKVTNFKVKGQLRAIYNQAQPQGRK